MQVDPLAILLFAGTSLAMAGLAIFLTSWLLPGGYARAKPILRAYAPVARTYVFRDGYLVSDVDDNDPFLDRDTDRSRAFEELRDRFATLDPEMPVCLSALETRGEAMLRSCSLGADRLTVSGRTQDDTIILRVHPGPDLEGPEAVDRAVLDALRGEIDDLRDALDQSPTLVWKQDATGQVVWANAPYLDLLARFDLSRRPVSWPLQQLFNIDRHAAGPDGSAGRHSLVVSDSEQPLIYDVTVHTRPDGSVLFIALPVDRLASAETALSNFMQTLTRTFAQLPTGLAVFDTKRQLVLFNPALTALSTLDAQFLSARPTLVAFLDALRDRQRVPEPRNYRAWRDEIARLERGAEQDSFHELWTLPTGETVRVTGRPYPDGGIAFMFEDITPEMSLTRKFRGELDLYRALFDAMPDALAVFSADGKLLFANAGYEALWSGAARPQDALEALRHWQTRLVRRSGLTKLRAFLTGKNPRATPTVTLHLSDGQSLSCRTAFMPGGARLVHFADGVSTVGSRSETMPLEADAHERDAVYEVAEPPGEFEPHRNVAGSRKPSAG